MGHKTPSLVTEKELTREREDVSTQTLSVRMCVWVGICGPGIGHWRWSLVRSDSSPTVTHRGVKRELHCTSEEFSSLFEHVSLCVYQAIVQRTLFNRNNNAI